MKLTLICIGKLSLDFLAEASREYEKRIRRYTTIDVIELKEEKRGGKQPDVAAICQAETEKILARIPSGAVAIALDETGEQKSSVEFARDLERHMIHGTPQLYFIVGGAYGLTDALRQQCRTVLSLSKMTWTHQMARVLLMEQLYRSLTIIRNEPYHNS
ncbi:MAG: 23S rRNA (pseudouridine(1915)-N(3))-methyltransferase RlmH [Desulfuromonadaceae bacterium]|nr:23S rRNA (pseudouridine(1915)-N(3))-methyltransferase RlmH [Desulfuromonadaceae bacterium]